MNNTTATAQHPVTTHLSPVDLSRYREMGYHFPIRVMSTQQAAAYMRKFEAYEAAYGPFRGTMRHKAHLYLSWLDELIRLPTILDPVSDILGPDIMVHSTSFFIKEPHDPAYVSWHQDGHYWGLDSNDVVTAWIALLDSDTENGAMRVIPGTHTIPMPHFDTFAENNMLSRGQEIAVNLDGRKWIELDLKAGEISLHHVGIIHGSEPNNSYRRRIGFAVRYIAPHVKQTISTTDGAVLVRGIDHFNNFEHEPSPEADMAPEGLAYHRYAMERMSSNLMKGTAKTMNDRP